MPEQHTDFIFTVVGEELGFLGGATLIGALRIAGVAPVAHRRCCRPTSSARSLAVGVLAIFAFQVFENIGMTMGIMPITGIPLPFMSYGGSAIITRSSPSASWPTSTCGAFLNVHDAQIQLISGIRLQLC